MKRDMLQLVHHEVGYPLIDHYFKRKEKGKIYCYPYPCHMKDFKKLIAFCEKNNLEFYVSGSTRYSSSTFELMIQDRERPEATIISMDELDKEIF